MNLKNQRRLAASVLGCSPRRVHFDPARVDDIDQAITKSDLRDLVSNGVITRAPVQGISRGRARALAKKKRRGQRRGHGSRKGKKGARQPRKETWITHVRSQRKLLQQLRETKKIDGPTFRTLYLKSKGGFFRSVRHIKMYIEEQKLSK